MAGVTVIINDAEVMAKLKQLSALNSRAMLDEIGSYMQSVTKKRFKDSTGPDGKQWLPLAPRTLLARAGGRKAAKKGGSLTAKPLIDRGHLMASITYQVGSDHVAIGTNMIYGAIHQFGGMAGRGRKVKISARPFLGVSPENRAEILDIMTDYVEQELRK